MATALFVCRHNAGRSQMSAALFDRAAQGRHRALSAGSEAEPAGHVHPQVVVVTMGCGDACPYIPGKRYLDWELPDPKGRPADEVRATRDEIDRRVRELVAELDAQSSPDGAGPGTSSPQRA